MLNKFNNFRIIYILLLELLRKKYTNSKNIYNDNWHLGIGFQPKTKANNLHIGS